MKWQVNWTWEALVKSSFFGGISMAIWGNVFSFLKMCIKGMASEIEIWKEENYWSSVMKKICALQTKTRDFKN